MKVSTKIASVVLLVIAICLYTINGIQPEFNKSKVYDNGETLVRDYMNAVIKMDEISYENEFDKKAFKVNFYKYLETVSKRNRLYAYYDDKDYFHVSNIIPNQYTDIYHQILSSRNNMNIQSINKMNKADYTQRLEEFLIEYDSSFESIPGYDKPLENEVYKVECEVLREGSAKSTYIIYFIVVDEGEGLVIDSIKVFNTTDA